MQKKVCILVLFILVLANYVYADNEYNININCNEINTFYNGEVKTEKGRILVPAKEISEIFHFKYNKIDDRSVVIETEDIEVQFFTGTNKVLVNNEIMICDISPIIDEKNEFIPFRFFIELVGGEVNWDSTTKSINVSLLEEYIGNIGVVRNGYKKVFIDMDIEDVINIFDKPERIDIGLEHIRWYIYNVNEKYEDHIMIGIKDDKVVAIEYASPNWLLDNNLRVLKNISDDDIENLQMKYLREGVFLEVSKDYSNDSIISVSLKKADKDDTLNKLRTANDGCLNSPYNKKVLDGLENQIFDYINVYRVVKGLDYLKYEKSLYDFSYNHSLDMIEKNYFGHFSTVAPNYRERIKNLAIKNEWEMVAENIAGGIYDAKYVVSEWVNKENYKQNLLAGFEKMGIAVEYGITSRYGLYFTANFAK